MAKGKGGGSRFLWVVSCAGEKCIRTDSLKDVEEILRSGLATIVEEDDEEEEEAATLGGARSPAKQERDDGEGGAKGLQMAKQRRTLVPRFSSLGDAYVHLMQGFASRGSFVGLGKF